MKQKTADDQYSAAETQKRLDQALRRSLQMPPPAGKLKRAAKRATPAQPKARKPA